jgi:hypothetical protein
VACILHDAYPAYISWEQYLATARVSPTTLNVMPSAAVAGAAPGRRCLQGLATCGHCGRVMKVVYKTRYATPAIGLSKAFAEPACAHLDGASAEAFVVSAFFEALQPAQLDVLAEVLSERQHEHERLVQWQRQQVARARYEAELARRRYAAVDPDNRLVAAELERAWEVALLALREAEEAAARVAERPADPELQPELRARLAHLSQALPALWAEEGLSNEQRKRLLRSLITRVILRRIAPDRVQVKIVWSAANPEGVVIPLIHRQAAVTATEMVARPRGCERRPHGYRDCRGAYGRGLSLGLEAPCRPPLLSRSVTITGPPLSCPSAGRESTDADGPWPPKALLATGRYRRIARGSLSAPALIRTEPYGT